MSVEVKGEASVAVVDFSKLLTASLVKDAYFHYLPQTGVLARRDFGAYSYVYLFYGVEHTGEEIAQTLSTFRAEASGTPGKQGITYTFLFLSEDPFTQCPYGEILEAELAKMDTHGVLTDMAWVNITDGTVAVLGGRTISDKKLRKVLPNALETWHLPEEEKAKIKTNLRDIINDRLEELFPIIKRVGPNPIHFLLVINIVLFIGGLIMRHRTGTDWFVRWGIQDNDLIRSGEVWRLVTSMFLHADLAHLGGNMLFLYWLGRSLYPHYSNGALWGMYLFSGLVGNLAGLYFTDYLSLGASGAIMGLGGVLILRMIWGEEAKVFRHAGNFASLAAMIGYNLVYGLFVPGIDNYGHFGGFIGGFLAAILLKLWAKRKHFSK